MMSGIRSKNTRPELTIRKALHAEGFRFCLCSARLPGKPDLVFLKYKAVIFVHGCFWHGHDCHLFKWPSSKASFWKQKIIKNKEKDNLVVPELLKKGWRVLIIWECALKGRGRLEPEKLFSATSKWLKSKMKCRQIQGKVRNKFPKEL